MSTASQAIQTQPPLLPPPQPPMAAKPRPQHGSNPFDLLPDALLGAIMAATTERMPMLHASSPALVCERWCRVFFSDSSVWADLDVFLRHGGDGQVLLRQLDALAGQLQRTGHLVRRLELDGTFLPGHQASYSATAVNARLPGLLRRLSPASLRTITLRGLRLTEEAASELHSHSQLEALTLTWSEHCSLPAGMPALLGRLPLLSLKLSASSIPSGVLAAIGGLATLNTLQLHSRAPLPDTQPLAALSGRLTSLKLCEEASSAAGLAVLPASTFPRLKRLALHAPSVQLPSGRVCRFRGMAISTDEWNHAVLQLRPPRQAGQPARACVLLQTANLDGQGALPALLGMLLPPHGASLAALDLAECCLTASSFSSPICSALLAQLTHLMLDGCIEHTARTDAALQHALGALRSLTPCLRSLHFVGGGSPRGVNVPGHCLRSGLPPAVAALQQLEHLVVVFGRIPDLPEELLLPAGLTELNLGGNALTGLPPNLAAATRLERLLLADNKQLLLTQASVDALAGLPRLRWLMLDGSQSNQGLVEQLQQRSPSVEIVQDWPAYSQPGLKACTDD